VFGTKTHYIRIEPEWEERLYSYLSGVVVNQHGSVLAVNGTADHVHILCTLPKEVSISVFLREIKANSSKWIHHDFNPKFAWQEGYGAFSVSSPQVPHVISYITNQKTHHYRKTWQEEFNDMLRTCGIEPEHRVI